MPLAFMLDALEPQGHIAGMNINRHPTVELRFRSIVSPNGRIPMVQITDITTGEVLMVELLKASAEWLNNLGYEWRQGSAAIWQLKDRGGNDIA